VKRKDKRPKRDSSANQSARPRSDKNERRGEARKPAPGGARADQKGGPSNPKRKARRTGHNRGPAAARLGERRVHTPQPPPSAPSAVIDERTAVDQAGLSDTDID